MDEKCSVCEKNVNDLLCGAEVNFTAIWPLTAYQAEEIQEQYGPYEIKKYRICTECLLRALGVPEPQKEG